MHIYVVIQTANHDSAVHCNKNHVDTGLKLQLMFTSNSKNTLYSLNGLKGL